MHRYQEDQKLERDIEMSGFLTRLGITSTAFVVVWACAAVAADAMLSSANVKTYHVW